MFIISAAIAVQVSVPYAGGTRELMTPPDPFLWLLGSDDAGFSSTSGGELLGEGGGGAVRCSIRGTVVYYRMDGVHFLV